MSLPSIPMKQSTMQQMLNHAWASIIFPRHEITSSPCPVGSKETAFEIMSFTCNAKLRIFSTESRKLKSFPSRLRIFRPRFFQSWYFCFVVLITSSIASTVEHPFLTLKYSLRSSGKLSNASFQRSRFAGFSTLATSVLRFNGVGIVSSWSFASWGIQQVVKVHHGHQLYLPCHSRASPVGSWTYWTWTVYRRRFTENKKLLWSSYEAEVTERVKGSRERVQLSWQQPSEWASFSTPIQLMLTEMLCLWPVERRIP